jgi:hypothetical protein
MISLCSFQATVSTPEGTPRAFDREIQPSQSPASGMVSALSGQPIGLRGHDEVVPMEAADLVGPPGHRDTPPLGEEGRMVTLRLSEGADPVGEGQRLGEVREAEGPFESSDPIALQQLPA